MIRLPTVSLSISAPEALKAAPVDRRSRLRTRTCGHGRNRRCRPAASSTCPGPTAAPRRLRRGPAPGSAPKVIVLIPVPPVVVAACRVRGHAGKGCAAAAWHRPGRHVTERRDRRTEPPMILYPAIDLKDGQCVRLLRGEMEAATVFGDDPAAQARVVRRGGLPVAAPRRPERRLRRAPGERRGGRGDPGARSRSRCSSAAASATWPRSRRGWSGAWRA